jgi:hypothetical protein
VHAGTGLEIQEPFEADIFHVHSKHRSALESERQKTTLPIGGHHGIPLEPDVEVLDLDVQRRHFEERRRIAPDDIGQAIGRLGCFAAGCCWGKPANVPWAVTFTDVNAARTVGTPLDTPLHPSQLYESLATLVIFTVLVWLAPRKKFQGQVVVAYVALYSMARFGLEFFRGDAGRGFIGPLSTSQAVAIALVLLASVLFFRLRKKEAVAPPAPQAPAAA